MGLISSPGPDEVAEPASPLSSLPRGRARRPSLVLVAGKGGVGKTTVSAALALHRAREGRATLLLSVDPAHSLADGLAVPLGPDPSAVPGAPGLRAMQVDAEVERRRFLESHRSALLTLLDRGTYLDSDDASVLADLAVPGMDELGALFRLRDLLDGDEDLVVDTAPTGHTLRLLDLPSLTRSWLNAFRAMEARDRAISTALVGGYQPGRASEMLDRLDRELAELEELLRDPDRCAVVLVTTRHPVVLAETLRYQEELTRRRLRVAAVVVNREAADEPRGSSRVGDRMVPVPLLDPEPVGEAGLRRVAAHLFAQEVQGGVEAAGPLPGVELRVEGEFLPPLDRRIYLIGGKGGVGKSTVAAALAVRLAREGRSVLLLGIDPAGSLGEVMGVPVSAGSGEVEVAPRLRVRQLDAGHAWEEFRAGYRDEAERLFAGLLGGGAAADREVVERMVDVAPPGIDELAALMEVVDATEVRAYDALVVDSAPTGHFLRLLELPGVALGWVHEVMRLLLKYREVMAPGALAERLLELARSLRRFDAALRDPKASWLLLVALPEALSVPETARLQERLASLGLRPGALLLNRAVTEASGRIRGAAPASLLAVGMGDLPVAAAPDLADAPRGPEALLTFSGSWHRVSIRPGEQMEVGP